MNKFFWQLFFFFLMSEWIFVLLQYLIFIFMVVITLLAILVCSSWVESIHNNLFSAFNFSSTKRTSLLAWRGKKKEFQLIWLLSHVVFCVGKFTCPSESTCHAVRHGVHSKWPHGSMRISLSFSAHILHNWKVLPVIENRMKNWKFQQFLQILPISQ